MTRCYECGGTGECPSCHGTGVGLTQKCIICRGSGACQACNPGGLVAPTVNTPRAAITRNYRWVVYGLGFLIACLGSMYRVGPRNSGHQAPGQVTRPIPITNVRMAVPDGWKVDNASPGLPPGPVLRHLEDPQYELSITQTGPTAQAHSCMNMIGSMKATFGNAQLDQRPTYIPDMYVGTTLTVPQAQLTCVNTGESAIAVLILLSRGVPKPQVLTSFLHQFAESATKQSGAVKGPNKLRLESLGIDLPLPVGAWGNQRVTDSWGTHDLIARQGGNGLNELEITPMLKKSARCESLMGIPQGVVNGSKQKLVQNPAYVGPGWFGLSLEQYPPPLRSLQAYVCRNVGHTSVLFTRIDYEGEKLEGVDQQIVRQMLTNLGEAVDASMARSSGLVSARSAPDQAGKPAAWRTFSGERLAFRPLIMPDKS